MTVPASSANIGPGFDCLGVAIDLPFHLDIGEPQKPATELDHRHPATTAFRDAGGLGPLFAETQIPPGKGLGFSGAARVAGLAAASLQQSGAIQYPKLLIEAGTLEGHYDNVAASIYGSITATNNRSVVRLHCPVDLSIVIWVPDSKTSTNVSRNRLPSSISFDAAVNAVGRSSVLIAAIATGAAAAWLSGSGPSVAAFVERDLTQAVSMSFPKSGHSKILEVAPYGISVS